MYNGKISPKEYNLKWWEMQEQYEGKKAPVQRPVDGMDIGRIAHIALDIPVVR